MPDQDALPKKIKGTQVTVVNYPMKNDFSCNIMYKTRIPVALVALLLLEFSRKIDINKNGLCLKLK